MEKVFVVLPTADRVREVWAEIARERRLPLGGWFPDDLEMEISALLLADQVRVYGEVLTDGMRNRIAVARALGKPIEFEAA